MALERQMRIGNQILFLTALYLAFYSVLCFLFHKSLTQDPSFILVFSNFILLVSAFIYWPIILLGFTTMAWVIWVVLSIFLLAIAFPFNLSFFYWHIPLHALMIMSISLLKRKDNLTTHEYTKSIQSAQENFNELSKMYEKNTVKTHSLNDLIQRYSLLHNVLNALNTSLNEQQIINLITEKTSAIINQGDHVLFYLNTTQSSKIQLRWSSHNKHQEIFNKQGDAYDAWILKHKIPLLVTDVHKDFRFQGISDRQDLHFQSLIGTPMIIENNCIGMMRIQSEKRNAFSMDDLRLLSILAYLATKAITNARLYQQTLELAIKDSLTGLYVRKHFEERFEEEMQRSLHNKQPLAFALIDIDHFKQYNDTYGHTAGDKVLIFLADMLKKSLGQDTIISRFGGEKFAILLPGHNQEQAFEKINQFRNMIAQQAIDLRQEQTQITISGGISVFPEQALLMNEIVDIADKGLYQAKDQGRNQICCM